ncbi:hypothetical protein MLD63_03860 [Paracoccus sp. TK19116]|uniref:Uncharacterized protein n=1 Tax=Paracoccus albicereus TaxID=2922394 RepID=A0ABT1MMR0_9RHOB|nr:hypothetical protein [Paracoccus albicereus]
MTDPDEIEAFLISIFDLSDNPYPCQQQDRLIRNVSEHSDNLVMRRFEACGVAIDVTRECCVVRHDQSAFPAEVIADAMLTTLDQLHDPAGMILGGLAAIWDSASIAPTIRLDPKPQAN